MKLFLIAATFHIDIDVVRSWPQEKLIEHMMAVDLINERNTQAISAINIPIRSNRRSGSHMYNFV